MDPNKLYVTKWNDNKWAVFQSLRHRVFFGVPLSLYDTWDEAMYFCYLFYWT